MRGALAVGSEAWVDCEVKPGPFPHERMVRVRKNGIIWVGFTHVAQLREPIPENGPTKIRVRLVELKGDIFTAKVLGHSVTPQPIHVTSDEVEAIDPQQARNPALPQ